MHPVRVPFRLTLALVAGVTLLASTLALAPPDDVEAHGAIEAIVDSTVTVDGLTFTVTDDTWIGRPHGGHGGGHGDGGHGAGGGGGHDDDDEGGGGGHEDDDEGGGHGEHLDFGDLEVGMVVDVRGYESDGGLLVARRITVRGDDGGSDGCGVHAEGDITALEDSSLTVAGFTFRITEDTEVAGEATVDDLEVGLRVEVRGRYDADSLLVAGWVRIRDGGDGPDGTQAHGPIETLTEASLTVRGATFSVTEATEIRGENDEPIPFEDLTVGIFVHVRGEYLADGLLVATEIHVRDFDGEHVEVRGAIEALGATDLTVAGVTFAVTDETHVSDGHHHEIPFEALEVGMNVRVHGRYDADSVLTARHILVERTAGDRVGLRAALDAVGDSLVVALGNPFLVNERTHLRDEDGREITIADLAAGDVVRLEAHRLDDGTLLAHRIGRVDEPADEVRLFAPVTVVGPADLEVLGVLFVVDEATEIEDHRGDPVALADIAVGSVVGVEATVESDGVLLARHIRVVRAAEATGQVVSAAPGVFHLPGVEVQYTAETLFLDAQGVPMAASALAAGQRVAVYGETIGEALVAATEVVVTTGAATAADPAVPTSAFVLGAAYPNPVAGRATLRYTLGTAGAVTVTVVDARGREVRRLVDATVAAGTHTATLDTQGLPAGVYFVRLSAPGMASATRSVVVIR